MNTHILRFFAKMGVTLKKTASIDFCTTETPQKSSKVSLNCTFFYGLGQFLFCRYILDRYMVLTAKYNLFSALLHVSVVSTQGKPKSVVQFKYTQILCVWKELYVFAKFGLFEKAWLTLMSLQSFFSFDLDSTTNI